MSALGWGVFVGATITAVTLPMAVDHKDAGAFGLVGFVFGVIAGVILGVAISVPEGLGLAAFFFPVTAIPLTLFAVCGKRIAATSAARQAAAAEAKAVYAERAQRLRAAEECKTSYFNEMRDVWSAQNACRLNGDEAIFAMNHDCSAIAIMPYLLGEEFTPKAPILIPLGAVISARVKTKVVPKTSYRTEIVPVATTNNRSPVARGLVGGLLFGPAGLVLGAASGLGGKTTIINEERQIKEVNMVRGEPTLVIGTTVSDLASVELSFNSDNVPGHWLLQIQAAKARSGRPIPMN